MLPDARDYEELCRQFRWQVPARYNIGVDCCDKWAAREPQRLALLNVHADGHSENITYGWLRETSNRLANVLAAHGIVRGERVAILLPQTPEVAAAHLAIYKLGAIALPLASLFGIDALSYRLQNSGPKAIVTDAPGLAKLAEIRADLPALGLTLSIDGAADGAVDFTRAWRRHPRTFRPSTPPPTIRR
jgi:acetyl-CoA synthetase